MLQDRLARSQSIGLTIARQQHAVAERALLSLSPLAVLGRGYALVYADDGSLVRDAATSREGDALRVRLASGALDATVTKTFR